MIKETYLHLAGELRWWGLGHKDDRISRLGKIENKIPYLIGSEYSDERCYLVHTLTFERHRKIFDRILSPRFPSYNVKILREKVDKLGNLVLAFQKNLSSSYCQRAFGNLPLDVKDLLYWAIGVENGESGHRAMDLGRNKLNQKFSLLSEIRTGLIFANGTGICEQALHRYERLYVLEMQRQRVNDVKGLSRFKEEQEILHKLEQLQTLEEYERVSLCYHRMNHNQREALLGSVSYSTKKFINALEQEYHHLSRFKNDPAHLYQYRGAHPKVDGTDFEVFAPHAKEVHLILTAYGKQEYSLPMQRTQWGTWKVFTEHAELGRTYRYRICNRDGNWQEKTDPFSFGIQEKDSIAESVVCNLRAYKWQDHNWMQDRARGKPMEKPLSIYELNVDYWKKKWGSGLSFKELAYALVDHHKKIPFTHVELYGVVDNRNDYSWGYQTNHFLAPNRRMGSSDDFKFLIDHCHQNGIGVIIDFVPSHFKHEHAGDLSQTLHHFDGTNHFAAEESPWGTLYFDYKKEETRRLILSALLYWTEVCHVDGFRFDAMGPALKRNGSIQEAAVTFFKEFNCKIHQDHPGIITIAEETDGFDKVARPVWEGGLGFDAKVGVHLQSDARHFFKTPYHERGGHSFWKMIDHLHQGSGNQNWMLAHSHDDGATETLYGSMPTDDLFRRFADQRLFHAFNLFTPGAGHLIHMGDELGQKWRWNERLTTLEGAVEWHLLDSKMSGTELHSQLLEYVGDLNRLYISKPPFWKKGNGGYRPISHSAQNQMVGFHRLDEEGGRLALFFNFSTMGYQNYDFSMPPLNDDPELRGLKGAKEIFNSDGIQYGGTGKYGNNWAGLLKDGEGNLTHFRIAIPPLSLLVFEAVWY